MKKKVNDPNEVTEQMVDEACEDDNPIVCKHQALILTTQPYQWKSSIFKIKHLREILGEARAYARLCPKSHSAKVKKTINAVANVINEHNKCVKVMCE